MGNSFDSQVSVRRILVATDYGASAMLALDYACAIANKFGSELHILHVFEDPLPLGIPRFVADPGEILKTLIRNDSILLGERTKHLQVEPTIEMIRAVKVGYASDEIHRYACEHDIDLIVLGTRGRHGLSRAIMGSVAEKTVRMAKCPVLTTHYSHSRELEKADPSVTFRTILVATDLSPAANRARDLALNLAMKFGSEVHLLNVVEEPMPIPGPEGMWICPEDITPTYVERASERLADNVAGIEVHATCPILRAVKVGYPSNVIERYAVDHKIDLIVVGTQGHRGLAHLLLGSVAEKIVRSASCPVLTTH
jgi:nucleotide-binding universal stress UspA family protein